MSETLSPVSTTKDRSTALTVVGSVQIALGALCSLFVPMSLLPLVPAIRQQVEMAQGAPPDARGVVFGAVFYAMLALFFVWTGIGAILKRRWVRPIFLSVSWMWLVAGSFAAVIASIILPRVGLSPTLRQTPGLTPQMETMIWVFIAGFLAIFYFILPLSFLLFYRSPHVRATLERRDPVPRWTDACPLPVLGLSLLMAFAAAAMVMAASFPVFPVFTALMTGPAAVALILVLAALYAYFARAAYRLQPIGWWGPLAVLPLHTLSGAVYLRMGNINEYLSAMGTQTTQSRMLVDSGVFGGSLLIVCCLAWLAVLVGYLLWVRKFFVAPTTVAAT
jgi:hypothetical protein